MDMLGYSPDEFQAMSSAALPSLIHPEDENLLVDMIQRLKDSQDNQIQKAEYRFRHKSGNWIWVADRATPYKRNSNGMVVQILGAAIDITEFENVKNALGESQERFKLAMAATQDGLFDWNLITNEIYYSLGWKRMLGYDDEELPNDFSIWENLTEPEDVKKSWKMQNELINKQRDRFEMEFKMKHKAGHWVDILSRAEAHFDKTGTAVRIVGTHVDITERKKAADEIRVAEQNLKNTIDISPSIIGKANLETGYFVEASPAVTRIMDYSVDEFTSQPFIEFIHPDDKHRTTAEISEQLSGKEVISFENRYMCKDGTYKWMAWQGTPADQDGIVTAVGSDITERKKAEQELQQAHDTLEERVLERTEELRKMINLMAGREVRMAELKNVIKKLRNQLIDNGIHPIADDPLISSENGF